MTDDQLEYDRVKAALASAEREKVYALEHIVVAESAINDRCDVYRALGELVEAAKYMEKADWSLTDAALMRGEHTVPEFNLSEERYKFREILHNKLPDLVGLLKVKCSCKVR